MAIEKGCVGVNEAAAVGGGKAVAFHAVVPCGGTGSRAGAGLPKQYRTVAGDAVLHHTLKALAGVRGLSTVVLVVAAEDALLDEAGLMDRWHQWVRPGQGGPEGTAVLRVCRCAGPTRAHTVQAGLRWLGAHGAAPEDWVLVHDAARCLVTPEAVQRLMAECADDAVGGLLALPLPDTLKAAAEASEEAEVLRVRETVSRSDKWLAQTPQMFRLGTLSQALERSAASGHAGVTDEASAVETLGLAPRLVPGRADNFKLTYPQDFALAHAILSHRQRDAAAGLGGSAERVGEVGVEGGAGEPASGGDGAAWRIGEGWDCHALVPGRRLVLGGVEVAHSHGLLGHSDADVLLHAVTDAVLGAAGLGDIGRLFPDTDARWAGADSRLLLQEAMARVRAAGWALANVDCTIVAQAPKLAPHMGRMVASTAQALGVKPQQVNIKAKTAERLGPVGQGLSMEARAVALLVRAPGAAAR